MYSLLAFFLSLSAGSLALPMEGCVMMIYESLSLMLLLALFLTLLLSPLSVRGLDSSLLISDKIFPSLFFLRSLSLSEYFSVS